MNPENLSSDQLRNYEQAETLAWEANKVFDISKEFAESFANDYILRQMHGITSNGEAFLNTHKAFETFKLAADTLMPVRAVFEPKPEPTPDTP